MSRGRGQDGFTIVELLVAMVTGLIVVGAAMSFIITSLDQQNQASSRAAATTQAEAGLQQLTRDLRNAMYQVAGSNASPLGVTVSTSTAAQTTSISFDIPTSTSNSPAAANDSSGVAVTWTCPSGAAALTNLGYCTRSVAGGTARRLINGVQSVTFRPYDSLGAPHTLSTVTDSTYTNPASVQITLDVQDVSQLDTTGGTLPNGTHPSIVLQTTADLRNLP